MKKGTTKKAAKEKLRDIEDRLSKGIYIPDKKIPTFGEVAKDWLEYKKLNLRSSTWSNYESYARNHFPDLNRIKVNRITIADIEKFIATWQKTGMHIKTLKRIIMIAGQILSYAVGISTDVGWENRQIHIQRTFNKQSWYDTKTETSNRRIDIGPVMMTELKKWKLACPVSDLDLIFPNKAGNPIDGPSMYFRYFKPALKKAGLGNIRFHDLRHTYASLLIEQGENIKYIQTQLGHSNPTITLNVYAHLMRPYNQESAKRLENSIFETTGHKMVTNTKNGKF